MSYYWSIPGSNAAPTYSIIGGQSSLHQERAYLLSALAAEESRGEQLTFSLDAARERLAAAEQAEDSADAVKNLKKMVTSLSSKLKRSQKSQKAMVNNLAAVTSRMQMLEQHQWRRAQFEYDQRSQLPSLANINTNMRNVSLVSPMTPSYQYQVHSPISPQTPGFAHSVPLTSMPDTVWATTYADGWGSPLYTPFYAQPYERTQAMNQGPLQMMQYPSQNDEALWRNVDYSSNAGQAPERPSLSPPVVQRSASWAGTDCRTSRGEDEAISPKSGMHLARRLSLMGGASSGLRLEKLVE